MSYKILRFFQDEDKSKEVLVRGLTLEQARTHCNRPDTRGQGWFDGYEEESGDE